MLHPTQSAILACLKLYSRHERQTRYYRFKNPHWTSTTPVHLAFTLFLMSHLFFSLESSSWSKFTEVMGWQRHFEEADTSHLQTGEAHC